MSQTVQVLSENANSEQSCATTGVSERAVS